MPGYLKKKTNKKHQYAKSHIF